MTDRTELLENTVTELLAALEAVITDVDEIFASTDHLEMALHLAKVGAPLTTRDGGPENFRAARAAIAKARGKE